MSETDVCKLIGKTYKTISEWRKSYEKSGIEGLLSISPGRGRNTKIDLCASLGEDIQRLQEERNGGRICCQDIVDFVREKHDIEYTPSGMYHVLHRIGFSWITSRSKHPKSNPEAMEAFKKTSKPTFKK